METGKNKKGDKIPTVKSLNDEQPAATGQGEEQIEVEKSEQQAEPSSLKKRGRPKKIVDPTVPTKVPAPQKSEQPIISTVSIPQEVSSKPDLFPTPKQQEGKDAELKEKYRKQQEDRLAALKRVRGNKLF